MPDPKIELITCHGWGLSPSVWDVWEELLPADVSVTHLDRGYFGEEKEAGFRYPGSRKIVMAHSFGLHWCPRQLVEQADHLIITGGFLSFHPDAPDEGRRSRLILRQMMSRFVEMPYEVLRDFYRNVWFPDRPSFDIPDKPDHDRLLHDLERLGSDHFPLMTLHRIPDVTIIHGEKDAIVHRTKGHELFNMLRKSRYLEIKEGGHAAVFTHAGQCYRFLKPLVDPGEEELN